MQILHSIRPLWSSRWIQIIIYIASYPILDASRPYFLSHIYETTCRTEAKDLTYSILALQVPNVAAGIRPDELKPRTEKHYCLLSLLSDAALWGAQPNQKSTAKQIWEGTYEIKAVSTFILILDCMAGTRILPSAGSCVHFLLLSVGIFQGSIWTCVHVFFLLISMI